MTDFVVNGQSISRPGQDTGRYSLPQHFKPTRKGQDVFYLVHFFDGADRSRYFKAVREVADKIELSIICDIADIDNFAIGVQRLHWQVGRELDPCVMADLAGVVVTWQIPAVPAGSGW